MAKRSTKDTVIDNTRALMSLRGDSTHDLAKRSGIPQSTVSRLLSGKTKISVDYAEAIAKAYGLDGWHLLMPNLPHELIESKSLSRLVSSYLKATDEGRRYIDSVAERESKYTANHDD